MDVCVMAFLSGNDTSVFCAEVLLLFFYIFVPRWTRVRCAGLDRDLTWCTIHIAPKHIACPSRSRSVLLEYEAS